MRRLALILLSLVSLHGQQDAAWATLDKAYEHLRQRAYDAAITLFRQAVQLSPRRTDVRKNLAYTLLKVGETEAARDAFAEAMRLDPNDHHVALEYAFLCHETGQTRQARLVFDRIRSTGDATARATAEQGFSNIDRPLAEGIARWQQVIDRDPGNFSAHTELARLAEQRNDWLLAARHFEQAWKIKPQERKLLLDLGRTWKETGKSAESMAALLAASRGPEPRTAEAARALLPDRYPYVYEFRAAIALDPVNTELRRELAYLHLEMGEKPQAETEFQTIVKESPDDLLSSAQLGFLLLQRRDVDNANPLLRKVLDSGTEDELADRVRLALGMPKSLRRREEAPSNKSLTEEARDMAEKSYRAGYLKDALKYLTIAHEQDPLDFNIMLRLGQTHNMLRDDRRALDWFRLARNSQDPSIRSEAQRAYDNLNPQFTRTRTTFWMLPFYSSRWRDGFSYAQVKTELRIDAFRLRPYLSMRFVGDARGGVNQGYPYPQYLSETAFILGGGVATPVYKGMMGWAEAGMALSYLRRTDQTSRGRPDYRGGISFGRAYGHLLGGEKAGAFVENHEDGVYVHRFNRSLLFYTQNKFGYTLIANRVQLYWNGNLTADAKLQYWANFVETGPGVRFRWPGLPSPLVFSVDVVRGVHTVNRHNPRRPNFFDIRVGFWYAFTK